ncbi:hypothetical protein [Primorskyibacter sp. 2E233]|uniref:hypothetical protein n=1 Tax=Primorskyibacter sp. 2E233 TaxID=3413431 RepID=UPI003BF3187D
MHRSLTAFCAPILTALLAAAPASAQDVFSNGVEIRDGNISVADLYVRDSASFGNACLGLQCGKNVPLNTTVPLLVYGVPEAWAEFRNNQPPGTGFVPGRDWRLRVNDNFNGGFERFSIEDLDADTVPFSVEGGAPENALWIDNGGGIGLGTMLPQDRLHMVGPFGPSLRFEQTGNGLVPPQIWRVIGQTGFSLADVTAGTTPFRIERGAPSNTLNIDDAGSVGVGTPTPAVPLHVTRADGSASVLVENTGGDPGVAREMFKLSSNGGSYFTFDNTGAGTTWFFVHENASPNRFIITDGVADGPEMTISAEGDLEIQGQLYTAGSCAAGCDRVFDADYPLPTIAEQAAMMRDLKHLPNVGPTPENGPFNITAMTGGMLNELEKAHLYIARLHQELAEQKAQTRQLAAQLGRTVAMETRLAALEALLEQAPARP